MSLYSKSFKPPIDLPSWDNCRIVPSGNNTSSSWSMTTAGNCSDRYLYLYQDNGINSIYIYDTWTDGWISVGGTSGYNSTITTSSINTNFKYDINSGYYNITLAADSTSITIGCDENKKLIGMYIEIVDGNGKGQKRLITGLSDLIISETCVTTSGFGTEATTFGIAGNAPNFSTNNFTNINKYVGYFQRIALNQGSAATYGIKWQLPINYNDTTSLSHGGRDLITYINPNFYVDEVESVYNSTAGSQTIVYVTSIKLYIDSPWNTIPDNTSIFKINSGRIWCNKISNWNIPYDVLMNQCFLKSAANANTGNMRYLLYSSDVATDFNIIPIQHYESITIYDSGTSSTTGTYKTLIDSSKSWTVGRWNNYRLKITNGTGFGEEVPIYSNDSTSLTFMKKMNYIPDNTTQYQIIPDYDKMYFSGNAMSMLFQNTKEGDMWTTGKIYDWGVTSVGCVTKRNNMRFPIASITNIGTTATATVIAALSGHMLKIGDYITVYGATGSDGTNYYNGNFTVASVPSQTTFTYTMTGTPSGSATFNSQGTSTLYDVTKNWDVNEHVNKIVSFADGIAGLITSNTSNSLTINITRTATSGIKYAICEQRALGAIDYGVNTDATFPNRSTDSSKNWPDGRWVGYNVRLTSGTYYTMESPIISSNSASVLSGASNSVGDTFSIYGIMPRGAGCQLIWIYNNSNPETRGKYIYSFRGGSTNSIDRYDITTEQWTMMDITNNTEIYDTGTQVCYSGKNRIYFTVNNTGRIFYLDVEKNEIVAWSTYPITQGSAIKGNRMEIVQDQNGDKWLYMMSQSQQYMYRTLLPTEE